MNRIMTALALSGLFVAAPAFAKTTHQGRRPAAVAKSNGKAVAGDKATGEKGEMKTEGSEGAETAKPTKTKKAKHTKKAKKTEAAPSEAPAEAPAK